MLPEWRGGAPVCEYWGITNPEILEKIFHGALLKNRYCTWLA
jgi:hypothetical protein